jgi:diguanylate cyclase (GGDEF)-like protein
MNTVLTTFIPVVASEQFEQVETVLKFISLIAAVGALYFALRVLPSIGRDVRKRSWLFLSLAAIAFGLSMIISFLSDVLAPVLHDAYELMEFFFVILFVIGFYYLYTAEHKETLKLKRQSTTDDLTNLFTHGFFQTYLVNKVSNLRSDGYELTVIFLDIDNFKEYNDKFGHQEGDYVLQKVAQVITSEARGEDLASRYGGEEFTLLLGCDFDTATQVAQRLRTSIAERCSTMSDPNIKRNVTVSIGLATYDRDATEADKLLKIADSRMYMAKSRRKYQLYTGDVELFEADGSPVEDDVVEPEAGTQLGMEGS